MKFNKIITSLLLAITLTQFSILASENDLESKGGQLAYVMSIDACEKHSDCSYELNPTDDHKLVFKVYYGSIDDSPLYYKLYAIEDGVADYAVAQRVSGYIKTTFENNREIGRATYDEKGLKQSAIIYGYDNHNRRYLKEYRMYEKGQLVTETIHDYSATDSYKIVSEYKNGKKVKATNYNKDNEKTSALIYKTNGKVSSKESFNNGVLSAVTTYDDNGKRLKITNYNKDKKTSVVSYNANGTKNNVVTYTTSGKVKNKTTYVNNRRNGVINYNDSGKMISKYTYHTNGKFRTKTTYANNRRNMVFNYDVNGKMIAKYKYHTNGKVSEKTSYTKGKKSSLIKYSSNGKMTNKSTYYTNGKLKTKSTYQNGKMKQKVTYKTSGKVKSNKKY